MKMKNNIILAAGIASVIAFSLIGASSNLFVQKVFAHSLNIQDVDVHGAGERQVTIVLGHTNEPAYGAKPGIDDGKHGVEVFLEDTATALPISGASLKVDKYYFSDFKTFDRAGSLDSATEVQKGVVLSSVFGDPGHYVARQVQKDGIYGYRLYGTISYFGAADLNIDSTVFCSSSEGNTRKFSSPGWFGGFGCTENIDKILFPTKNNNVNSGNGRVTFEVPGTNGATVQHASTTSTGTSLPTNVAATETPSISGMQFLILAGIPAAGIAGVFVVRNFRHNKKLSDL
jgi:hypothetical protein